MPITNSSRSLQAPLANTGCFGCGSANRIGLHLQFERHPEQGVEAIFRPSSEHQGWDGMVHGGLVGLLLDEAMAWAAFEKTVPYVTAKLEIRYRHPIDLQSAVRLRGWVERDRGRTLETAGQLLSEAGEICAEGTALFVRTKG